MRSRGYACGGSYRHENPVHLRNLTNASGEAYGEAGRTQRAPERHFLLAMMADKGVPKVLLFLAEGFEDLEAVSVLDVFGWTEYREHIPEVLVVTAGLPPEVKGRFGLQIRPDLLLKDVRPGDFAALAIPGGFFSVGYGEAFHPLLYEIVRSISGTAQSVDVALLLLENLIGPEAVREVRRFMVGMELRSSSTMEVWDSRSPCGR
jgi:hypothetical protein